jgi:hypothetical protein
MKAHRSRQILAARSREKARQADRDLVGGVAKSRADDELDQPERRRRDPPYTRVRMPTVRVGY